MQAKPYRIDSELRRVMPPLTIEERKTLKANIRAQGCITDPLIVWREAPEELPVLVDGHNRDEIVDELWTDGIEIPAPSVLEMQFADRLAIISWMRERQKGRRNATPDQMAAHFLQNQQLRERLRAEAQKRQRTGKKVAADSPKGRMKDRLAGLAGVSRRHMDKVEKLLSTNNHNLIERVINSASPDEKLSVDAALTKHRAEQEQIKRIRLADLARNVALPPVNPANAGQLDCIHFADVLTGMQLVPDNSVSICMTSPPYFISEVRYNNEGNDFTTYVARINHFRNVFGEVHRTLRNGGRCVINIDASNNRDETGPHKAHNVYADMCAMMDEIGFRFYGEFAWYKQNTIGHRPNFGTYCSPECPNIRRQHEYLLVFFKGSTKLSGNPNAIDITEEEFERFTMSHWYVKPAPRKTADDLDFHPVPYPEELVYRVLKLFSYVGDTILDPFCGSGTTPFVAKALSRRYVGIDNVPTYAESARRRLATLDGLRPEEMRARIKRFQLYPNERADGYGDTNPA